VARKAQGWATYRVICDVHLAISVKPQSASWRTGNTEGTFDKLKVNEQAS